jgi:subtilase family serine protease
MSSKATPNIFESKQDAGIKMLALLPVAVAPALAMAQAKVVASVPGAVARASDHGPIEADAQLKLTVWLAMHNKQEFDQRVEALYTAGSPTYHKWLSPEDLLAYAPTKAELKTVEEQLEKSGLTVTVDAANPFVMHAAGTADKVQAVFGTEIDNFEKNGSAFHSNITEGRLGGDAASLIVSVGGLHNLQMKPQYVQAKNPKTGKVTGSVPLAKVKSTSGGLSAFFTNACFPVPSEYTFGAAGQLPVGVYFGNVYSQGDQACGYTAQQMQAAYGLPAVYKAGLKGAGQTIVILDGYGSPTIEADANNFNALNGLPALNSTNFKVVYSDGLPLDPSLGAGWLVEVSLDVEWAHAIAPAAKIVLLAAPSGDDQDLQYAIQYAALHKLGSVISNSYGSPEIELGPADLDGYNQVIEQAAAVGISVNFSSGDQSDLGLGTPVGAILTPSDSPYATAVGGTSIGIPGGTDPAQEVGWGNNQTFIASGLTAVADPPYNFGNVGGAGGGQSVFFAKPSWQKALPGKYRLDPDVALEADPYTGAVIIYTDPVYGPTVEAIGGTSLAAPMFSAFWALASEKAGHWLGQAAPIISKLPANALNDIVPVTSATNVVGTVIDSTGAAFYSAADLAGPLQNTTEFTSAIWPIEGEFIDLTFGTDGSLGTAKGWDDVTGFGTPAGLAFITAAAKE